MLAFVTVGPQVVDGFEKAGGDEGIRTPDLLVANEALYQLSYIPNRGAAAHHSKNTHPSQATKPTADCGTSLAKYIMHETEFIEVHP